MERIEIIKELAQYEHPDWYHAMIYLPTDALKKLLDFYKNDTKTSVEIDIFVSEKVGGEPLKKVMKFKH